MTLREKFSQWLEKEPFDIVLLAGSLAVLIVIAGLTMFVIALGAVMGGVQ